MGLARSAVSSLARRLVRRSGMGILRRIRVLAAVRRRAIMVSREGTGRMMNTSMRRVRGGIDKPELSRGARVGGAL